MLWSFGEYHSGKTLIFFLFFFFFRAESDASLVEWTNPFSQQAVRVLIFRACLVTGLYALHKLFGQKLCHFTFNQQSPPSQGRTESWAIWWNGLLSFSLHFCLLKTFSLSCLNANSVMCLVWGEASNGKSPRWIEDLGGYRGPSSLMPESCS